MSRTYRKGEKGIGYEYWAKRWKSMVDPGPDTKRETNRGERRISKDHLRKGEYTTEVDYHRSRFNRNGEIDD